MSDYSDWGGGRTGGRGATPADSLYPETPDPATVAAMEAISFEHGANDVVLVEQAARVCDARVAAARQEAENYQAAMRTEMANLAAQIRRQDDEILDLRRQLRAQP